MAEDVAAALAALPFYECKNLHRLCMVGVDDEGAPSVRRRYKSRPRQPHSTFADPKARQVLADWLLDRGDPRGEILQLEVQRKPYVLETDMTVSFTDARGERRRETRHGVQVRHFPFRDLHALGVEGVASIVKPVFQKLGFGKEKGAVQEAVVVHSVDTLTSRPPLRSKCATASCEWFGQKAIESWRCALDEWPVAPLVRGFEARLSVASLYLTLHRVVKTEASYIERQRIHFSLTTRDSVGIYP